MSDLVVTNLNGVAVNKLTATAWVNFNGTGTVAIRDSYNVDSITDNAVGDYNVDFTTDMDNANYVTVGMCDDNADSDDSEVNISGAPTISNFKVTAWNNINGKVDRGTVCVSVFGGLT